MLFKDNIMSRSIFASEEYSLPKQIVADNGLEFTSKTFLR
ncbi:hypothetical protein LEP1GSC058_2826 [Leptospira fainei serovar Hurstbridge str. BUT 6]|uniref:Integrase core domain protein n=1 Tax=Leptospira fainei serovar Hurstbridge str. BUT 6 TaxID=1193011 RepID=S3W120_9LEPT|nr:hypothetical protein LEP1GSC058_2826 [Leptospira fainei serovar Hurstbridge str. BUT 6]